MSLFNNAWKNINRLRHVLSLFNEDRIVQNFSNMKNIFEVAPIKKTTPTDNWEEALQTLPEKYKYKGKENNLEKYLSDTATTSLLVTKDSKIAYENYYLGTDPTDLRLSWSMAKSFLSALFGVAIANGDIESIDIPVNTYVPEFKSTAYDMVSIRDILNMSSGIEFDEDYLAFNSDINKMGRVLGLGGSMDKFTLNRKKRKRKAGIARQYIYVNQNTRTVIVKTAAHREFRDDGHEGYFVKEETIEMFRAISSHLIHPTKK